MLNIHIWALAAVIIVSVLAFDAIGSGVLHLIHGNRTAGLRWMAGGLAGTSVAALLMRIDTSIPLAAVIIPAAASATLLIIDLLMITRRTAHFDRRSYDSGLDKTEKR